MKTQIFDKRASRIDMQSWPRTAIFERFRRFEEPYHGVCLRIDCSEAFQLAKQQQASVFLTFVHCALTAAQDVPNMRLRIVDDAVWEFATIHGGSAVGRANGTIGFGHYAYHRSLATFVRTAARELDRVRNSDDLDRFDGQNLIRFSVLPWLDFTSIDHAREFSSPDSAPKITFGKISQAAGRCSMPVSIHVHHGLMDGLHVAQFVQAFEMHLSTPVWNETDADRP